MAAVTVATMINNTVLIIISSKFEHTELLGNHYFGMYVKKKSKSVSGSCNPPPPPPSLS